MKYFSMFSGIGGFEYGIERACFQRNQLRTQQWEGGEGEKGKRNNKQPGSEPFDQHKTTCDCVGFSEIDKYATAIYQYHFPEHKAFGDAFNIDPGTIPDFDLLCGGFPCQAFSIAGKRGGFKDTRGTLFFEIARILSVKRPKFLLLENVKGLLSHDHGRTFGTILSALSDLGYFLEWQVLNSKDFGVPQNRERVFIVGHLGGIGRGQVFPIGEDSSEIQIRIVGTTKGKDCTRFGARDVVFDREGLMGCLKSTDYKQPPQIMQLNNPKHSNDRVYADKVLSPTLNTMQGGNRQPKVLKEEQRIRRLTPIECERLQAFPDNWTKFGRFGEEVKEISDSQRYKCLGNSVTTTVVTEVVKRIKQS